MVHLYSPDIPMSSVYCTITPMVFEHALYGLISSEENLVHFCSDSQSLQFSFFLFSQVSMTAWWTETTWNEKFA